MTGLAGDYNVLVLSFCKNDSPLDASLSSRRFVQFAIAARPRLGPIFVTTITARMRVFHRQEIKIFLPIGALFFQWRVTKTSLHPMRLTLGIHARHLHVVQVLVARD